MKATNRLRNSVCIWLGSAWLGCTAQAQPSLSVAVSVPLPTVQIRVESDFYEPLTPHGEWVVVGTYGRCWRPGHVARDWRPYCNGSWERTDDGWYWVSDEPWGWATYHYGRWDFTEQYGWYWVPQTQWAPAWVSWHSGGGYIGWAPLQPAVRISASGYTGFNAALIPPRAFVFVEQSRFLEPIRATTVAVNNTTILHNTTTLMNAKMVNNTVLNEGPATTAIEKASGRKIETVPVHELRHQTEAAVISKQQTLTATGANTPEKKNIPGRGPAPIEKPAAVMPEPAKPAPKNNELRNETRKPAPAAGESKPAAKPEGNNGPVIKESAQPKASQRVEPPRKPANKNGPPAAQDKPAANEKGGANAADPEHEKKSKE